MATAAASLVGLLGPTRTLLFAAIPFAFAVLLPLSVALSLRAIAHAEDPSAVRLPAITAGVGLAALLGVMRLAGMAGAPGDGIAAVGTLGGLAVAAAAWLPRRSAKASRARKLAAASGERLAVLAVLVLAATLLVFAPAPVTPAAVAVAAAGAAIAALVVTRVRVPRLPSAVGIALDVGLLLVAALLVVDVTGYWGVDSAVSASSSVPADALGPVARLHHHFYLGPVNDILHGRTLLVDASSVYGIGNAYLIAAWFQLAPLGYGPFGLLASLCSVVVLVLGWAIGRAAGVSRAVAAVAVAVAVLLTVLAPVTSPTLFVNVSGLRFGPPFVLLAVALLVSGREGPVTRSPWVVVTFAFFSLWSIETIVYCGGAYLALVAAEAVARPDPRAAIASALRSLALLLAACLAAQMLLALLTRVRGGEWPDPTGYISLFKGWADVLAYAYGGDVEPWSRVWPLGALYLASAVGVALLVRGAASPPVHRRTVLALAGLTGTGASFLSYFASHSDDLYLPFVAYPALLVAAIWISLALRPERSVPLPWRRAALAIGAYLAILLAAGSWSAAEHRFPRTALAHMLPGGATLRDDARLMWSSPPIDPRAAPAADLIERYFPNDEALVLLEPDLGLEALLRSGRTNLLPTSYPWQDEVNLDHSLPPVEDAVAKLDPGTRVLIDDVPTSGRAPAVFGASPDVGRLGSLESAALQRIRERFDLETVARGPGGLRVAELVPRSAKDDR